MESLQISNYIYLEIESLDIEPGSVDHQCNNIQGNKICELEQKKQELDRARKTISEQSWWLKRRNKKIEKLEETLRQNEELLRRLQSDHKTENEILGEEKNKIKRLLYAERRKWTEIIMGQQLRKMFRKEEEPITEMLQIDGNNVPEKKTQKEARDADDDDITVLEVIEKGNSSRSETNFRKRCPLPITVKSNVSCEGCGITCSSDWHLLEHLKDFHPMRDPLEETPEKKLDKKDLTTLRSRYKLRDRAQLKHASRVSTPESTEDETWSSRSSAAAKQANDDEYKVESCIDEDGDSEEDVKSFPGKQFQCQCCKQRHLTSAKLKSHMESAHDIGNKSKLMPCVNCGSAFSTESEHKLHCRNAHGAQSDGIKSNIAKFLPIEPFLPPTMPLPGNIRLPHGPDHILNKNVGHGIRFCTCGCSYRSKQGFKRHIYSLQKPSVQQTMGDEKNIIPIVKQQLQQRRHALVGPDPRKFKARYPCSCGNLFRSRPRFMTHLRSESKTNEKIFRCNLCRRAFEQHVSLKKHMELFHKITFSSRPIRVWKLPSDFRE